MVQVHLLTVLCLAVLCTLDLSCAQTVVNGQVYTQALAIVNYLPVGAHIYAGSYLNLTIDVSGNGKLAYWKEASVPGSSYATRYDGLEVYLVSSITQMNLTVSSGLDLLAQEQGSAVKHLNWPVPTCIGPGNYNLTVYETSHIDGQAFFSITPLSLDIQNPNPSGVCSIGMNVLQAQPQQSLPPPINPWIGSAAHQSSSRNSSSFLIMNEPSCSTSSLPGFIAVIHGRRRIPWPHEHMPMMSTSSSHMTLSSASSGVETVTVSFPEHTTTAVVVSSNVILSTTTINGKPSTSTTTLISTSLSTATTTIRTNPTTAGFLPVNSSKSQWIKSYFLYYLVLGITILFALTPISL